MGIGKKIAAAMLFALGALAQSSTSFKTRLAPVAIDAAMKATVADGGSVKATLAGGKLTIGGTFDGLRSPATRRARSSGKRGRCAGQCTAESGKRAGRTL